VASLVTATLVTACKEEFVPDYNAPTAFPHSLAALQNEFTGMFDGPRVDAVTYTELMEGMSRNAGYYTASEVRFVTQWTGMAALDNSSFGGDVWNNEYSAAKVADTVLGIIPTLTLLGNPVPAANREAMWGVAETFKALDLMYIAEAHDTTGTAINTVGQALGSTLAPILCNKDAWGQIVAMYDSAIDSLNAAGPSAVVGVPGTGGVTIQYPNTFSILTGSNGGTAGLWAPFTLALRGKARVEYAYALARSSAGTAPTPTSPGSPDQNQLDSAIVDIEAASPIYSSALTPGEMVMPNDNGVFNDFSTAPGDRQNSLGTFGKAIFALNDFVADVEFTVADTGTSPNIAPDTTYDPRFYAKFAKQPSGPTSSGSAAASAYGYTNNNTPSTRLAIVRNLELQFVLAQAYLGTGQYANAISVIDNVRTSVAGLPSLAGSISPDYVDVRNFLLSEQRPTLVLDGTGDRNIALREYGMVAVADTTWGAADYKTSMEVIPLAEINGRNGSATVSCP
jgi:hypothetical protein